MSLSFWDIAIVVAYLLLLLGLGIFLKHKADSGVRHYFLSGKGLPWWVAGTSMAASAFSADTPLYVTDITRQGGLGANWEWWCYVIGGAFSVYFLARLWRRAGVLTDVELSELRYDGNGAKILRGFRALVFSIFVNCLAMALVIKAIVTILSDSMGVSPVILIPVCLVVTAVYSLMSGFWGVVVTDFLQFFMALAGALLLMFFSLDYIGCFDPSKAFSQNPLTASKLNLFPVTGEGFWQQLPVMLAMIFGVQWWAFINADGGGKIIQRQLACRDEREASRATMWFIFTHYVLRTWPWIVVAFCSILIVPQLPEGDRAYIAVALKVLPRGLLGFMLATFLAAFMSTIDTQLNWGSSYFVNDFYARFIKPGADEKHLLAVSRISGAVFLILAAFFTLTADSVTSIFRFILAMGAGVGPIYILRWFWWRINAWTEIVAMSVSMITATVCRAYGLPLSQSVVITLVLSLTLAFIVTFLTAPVSSQHLERFVTKTRPFGLWKNFRNQDALPDAWFPALCGWLCLTVSVFSALFGLGWLLQGMLAVSVLAHVAALAFGIAAIKFAESAPQGDAGR